MAGNGAVQPWRYCYPCWLMIICLMKDIVNNRYAFRIPALRGGLLLCAALLLVACAGGPVAEPPAVIHENVHSGGSVVSFSENGRPACLRWLGGNGAAVAYAGRVAAATLARP